MLILDVLGATLVEEFGGTVDIWDEIKPVPEEPITKPRRENRLNFSVKLADDQRITLSGGTHLDKLSGHVTLYPNVADIEDGAMGIGVMSYRKAVPEESVPASYWIRVRLPQAQFDGLLSAARVGRAPSSITVNERGMTLPDAFSMEWDETASPHLHISSIYFSVPLAEQEDEMTEKPSELAALTKLVYSINRRVRWLTALVAMGTAIALLHFFR